MPPSLFVGDGVTDQARTLERDPRLIGSRGLRGWPDDPNQLREYYRRAFGLLLPSEIEAFGMVILEAMAAGTPVVMTATGGLTPSSRRWKSLSCRRARRSCSQVAVKRLHSDADFYLRLARAAQRRARASTRGAWQESFCERADRLIREGRL